MWDGFSICGNQRNEYNHTILLTDINDISKQLAFKMTTKYGETKLNNLKYQLYL